MLYKSKLTLNKKARQYFPKRSKKVKSELIKKMKASILSRIPSVKPMPMWVGVGVFTLLSLVGMSIGATIGTYVFFGIATLLGLIAIVESNRYIRYLVTKMNKTLDLIIFGATLYATAAFGVTISAALVFAGLGYTWVYAPWLRQREELLMFNIN